MKKYLKRISAFVIALSIVFTTILLPSASTDIKINVVDDPEIDIVLTVENTDLDLSNFKQDILNALKEKGFNTDNITVTSIETIEQEFDQSKYSPEEIYNTWSMCPNPNSTIVYGEYIVNDSKVGIGKASQWGSNQTFVYDESAGSSYIEYEADLLNHNCCAPSGLIVNYDKETDVGYVLLVGDAHDYFDRAQYQQYMRDIILVRIDNFTEAFNSTTYDYGKFIPYATNGVGKYTVLANVSTGSITHYHTPTGMEGNGTSSLFDSSWHKLKVIIDENGEMNFYVDGNLAINYNFGKGNADGAVGLMFQCRAWFKNISIKMGKTIVKDYNDIMYGFEWNENADRYIVNVDNFLNTSFTDKTKTGEILSRTINENIHFIQWGNDNNKNIMSNFIKQNNNNGLFIENNNYEIALNKTVDYIVSNYNLETENDDQYVIINTPTNLNINPSELATNTKNNEYPNGRWMVRHDANFFENGIGQSEYSNQFQNDLNLSFDKPGKYSIYFEEELVKIIYAHRKPIANFIMKLNNDNTLSLTNLSYDLDSNIDNGLGNGIKEVNWKWKNLTDTEWINGIPTKALTPGESYIIQLSVIDEQNVESIPMSKYITLDETIQTPPVAAFNFENSTIFKNNKLEIVNTSYDPSGKSISSSTWTLKKDGVLIGTYSEPVLNFNTTDLGIGKYSYTLVVTNSDNIKSEAYTKSFEVVNDVIKPEITIDTEVDNEWVPEKEVDIEVTDNESYIAKWRYEFVTSPTPTTTDDEWSNWEIEKTKITINSGVLSGRYYLHIQAYDEANNLSERTIGPFNLDNTNPVINGVDVNKLGFRETKVTVDAFDEHSGIVGYALTKYETATFSLRARTFAATPMPEFQESNEFIVDEDGLYTAWAIDALGNVETSICEVTQSNQTDKTTNVYAEIGSEFKVTIPKRIVLDGSTKSGTYNVTVEGDIAGLETITVEPENAVTLNSKDKPSVIGSIAQDKINWTYGEIYTDSKVLANGAISAQDITAGAWNGTFNFNIKLENNGKYTNSEWNVEYQEFIFGTENTDNSNTINPTE